MGTGGQAASGTGCRGRDRRLLGLTADGPLLEDPVAVVVEELVGRIGGLDVVTRSDGDLAPEGVELVRGEI